MTRKLVLTLLAALTIFGSTVAYADGGTRTVALDDGSQVSAFVDERINGFDISAPVAVYRMAETVAVIGEDGLQEWGENDSGSPILLFEDVFAGYEFWGVIDEDGGIQKVMEITAAEIDAANASGSVVVKTGADYSVQYDPASGWLWLSATNGYSFAWEL